MVPAVFILFQLVFSSECSIPDCISCSSSDPTSCTLCDQGYELIFSACISSPDYISCNSLPLCRDCTKNPSTLPDKPSDFPRDSPSDCMSCSSYEACKKSGFLIDHPRLMKRTRYSNNSNNSDSSPWGLIIALPLAFLLFLIL